MKRENLPGRWANIKLLLGFCCVVAFTVEAAGQGFKWDGETYGYLSGMDLQEDSLLNPDNQIANLPEKSAVAELRLNLRARWDKLRMSMRPILLAQENRNDLQEWQHSDAYLSQWLISFQAANNLSLNGGREILNWGPAQFRSLTSPFYFDNGRDNPLQELSGIDSAWLLWSPNREQSLSLTWVSESGHNQEEIWHDTVVLKAESRGDDWAGGLILSQTPDLKPFAGLYVQYTVSDALLVYTESASLTYADALRVHTDESQPFTIESESPRRTNALLGAAYTLENGQSINLEYLHYRHGYDEQEEAAYFAAAEASPLWAAQALAYAPPLLGRDYLYLVWQSNPLNTTGYWRLMATHNFTDNSEKYSAYIEYRVSDSITLFALGEVTHGDVRQEFSSLYRSTGTLGLKMALP
ncbi:MAG: hypothetical protein ABW170_15910 [Candidatus Thiodiazotropha sp. L084R]